jgi:hypothetical protein
MQQKCNQVHGNETGLKIRWPFGDQDSFLAGADPRGYLEQSMSEFRSKPFLSWKSLGRELADNSR